MRVGRYGPFLEQGERRASVPDDMPPDELTLDRRAGIARQGGSKATNRWASAPKPTSPVFVKVGRFGPYVQLGTDRGRRKAQERLLLKGMERGRCDLDTALKLLSLPRTLGDHPENHEPVVAHNGRYGPYVKCESRNAIAARRHVTDRGRRSNRPWRCWPNPRHAEAGRRRKNRSRSFDESPVTGQAVKLLEGRYGPYVTDGTTNASLPKGAEPDETDV